jgi:PAS domain S-box-containing protein
MKELTITERVQRSIIVYSALGIILVSFIVACVSIIPLYGHLKEDEEQNLLLAVNTRAVAIEEYLSRTKDIASQITSRTRIREVLESYNRGEIDYDELVEFSEPKLADAMSISPEILGMVRYDQRGEPVVTLSLPFPIETLPATVTDVVSTTVYNPVRVDEKNYLVVSAPIRNQNERVGTDVVVFNTSRMQAIIADTRNRWEVGETILGMVDDDDEVTIFCTAYQTEDTLNTGKHSLIKQAFEQATIAQKTDILKAKRNAANRSDIIAYAPVKGSQWAVVIQQDTKILYAAVNWQIEIILLVVVALVAVGTVGITRLMKPLAGKLVLQADELQREVQDKTVALQQELHERQRTAEELDRMRHYNELILDAVGEGVFGLDLNGNTTFVNPAALRMVGYTAEEMLGKSMHEMVHYSRADRTSYPQNLCPICRALSDGEVHHVDNEVFWRKDGKPFLVEYICIPMFEDGQAVGTVVTFQDVTERRQYEEDLRRAREVAEAATRAKSEFLANMSHEIRTPMNAVIGMTNLMLDTELSLEQRDFVETIRTSGSALLTIINDILDLSKIEADRMELENQPFNLRLCVEEAVDLVSTEAARKHLELGYLIEPGTPEHLVGDMPRLRQVLVNLLNNAVKFTNEGEVLVLVDTNITSNDEALPIELPDPLATAHSNLTRIHVSVRDTGIGIPKDRLERLFRPFSQTDSSMTRRYGGTGLGLAISKRLAEMMGGSMWVETEYGKGSTFHFTIVVQQAEEVQKSYLCTEKPQLSGKRALIVDDNATNRFILMRQLETWGMLPFAATSGPEALAMVEQYQRFDVAILDLHMPDMDGLTLSIAIRRLETGQTDNDGGLPQEPDGPLLPLILMPSMEPGLQAVKDTGVEFAAVLTKPVKPALLFNSLYTIFAAAPESLEVVTEKPPQKTIDPEMGHRFPLHILLAEDNVVNQKVALRFLDRMGYRADVAGNGLEVLEALERQMYDVVLMDVQMPEMDGWEATRTIRKRLPPERQPHIIAMTAHALEGDREKCFAMGMDDYVSKPFQVEDLVLSLQRVKIRGQTGVFTTPRQSETA